jgi:ABC-type transport system substrate-binding protein
VLFGRRFELALVRWPPINGRFPCEVWQTEQIASAANPAGVNVSGYSNAEFDAACRRVQTALDSEALAAWEAQVRQIVERDVPAVEVGRSRLTAYVRPGVNGIRFSASAASELWGLEAVRVAP